MKRFVFIRKTSFVPIMVGLGVFFLCAFAKAQFCPLQGPPDCSVLLNNFTAGYDCLPPAAKTYVDPCTALKLSGYVPVPPFGTATLPPKKPPVDISYLFKAPVKSVMSASHYVASKAVYTSTVAKRNFQNRVNDDVVEPIEKLNDRHPSCDCQVDPEKTTSNVDPTAQSDLDSCKVHEVTSLPGSHQYASDFIESMASDPDPAHPSTVYGLTAGLSSNVKPIDNQAMYVSKSTDGGKTWRGIARIPPGNFRGAGEGLHNRISVGPGGDIVVTTQQGAYQVAASGDGDGKHVPLARITPINGPRLAIDSAELTAVKDAGGNPANSDMKKRGDAVGAGDVKISHDGQSMLVSYGDFDGKPQLVRYHKDDKGAWQKNAQPDPLLPSEFAVEGYHEVNTTWVKNDKDAATVKGPINRQILSVQFDPNNPNSEYVGTANGAFHLDVSDPNHPKWQLVSGVGSDAAVHAMSTEGGLRLATCGGVYNSGPTKGAVIKAASKTFVFPHVKYGGPDHDVYTVTGRDKNKTLLRAYSVEVDPAHHERVVVTSAQGVYLSRDGGRTWENYTGVIPGKSAGLPECELASKVESVKPTYDPVQCAYLKDAQMGRSRKHEPVPGMKDTTMGPVDPNLYPSEFRTAHFAPDGSVVVSGSGGTYLVNPFAPQCSAKSK